MELGHEPVAVASWDESYASDNQICREITQYVQSLH